MEIKALQARASYSLRNSIEPESNGVDTTDFHRSENHNEYSGLKR
jgi:hypothetical protein